jgi:hypothetical protein
MRTEPIRVVYENRPYLVMRDAEGHLEQAWGPFTPGTEPSLAECSPDVEVTDSSLRATLDELMSISPTLPSSDDTLAAS